MYCFVAAFTETITVSDSVPSAWIAISVRSVLAVGVMYTVWSHEKVKLQSVLLMVLIGEQSFRRATMLMLAH